MSCIKHAFGKGFHVSIRLDVCEACGVTEYDHAREEVQSLRRINRALWKTVEALFREMLKEGV